MGIAIPVMILTMVLFLAMILLLAAKPRFAGRLTGAFLVIAGLGGLFFYGYGFAVTLNNLPLAVIRALLAVCGMFVAKMDISSISAAPLMQHTWAQLLFWLVHLFALYATASAAITTVGAEALRKLRLWLARWGSLHLIYGVSDESLAYARQLLAERKGAVVFVDGKPDANLAAAISKTGCVLRTDEAALRGDMRFLKSIGAHRVNRKITLYAMESCGDDNVCYARNLLETLRACEIPPRQTNLVIRGQENSTASNLQALGERYGYGFVTVIQESSLAARMLMQEYPPCNAITFDENCRAESNFEALVVGFGQIGQAVLRQIVMNGQFEGSQFRAAVFSPDCKAVDGYFANSFGSVLSNYDIAFHPHDARSRELYDYLAQRGAALKYVVICAGSEKTNHEIAEDMMAYFDRMSLQIPVYLCSRRGIRAMTSDAQASKLHSLYQTRSLSMTGLDQMAMILNHHYMGPSERSALEDWMNCDYFSRMSNRAAADFLPAMLRMAGKTEQEVLENRWKLTPAQMENLSRTEHLRWCAFHYCMGFSTMTREEFDSRAAIYREQLETDGIATIRIGKNMEGRTHACLIDWEELDDLSERESAVTGKQVNYKKKDLENVLAVPRLIRNRQEFEV